MCTAIRLKGQNTYFGRNLDLNASFGEQVVLTPRNYPFSFTDGERSDSHYAILGMATIAKGYPLYADAFNEKGLAMAGLNYPGNARYFERVEGRSNVSPFELIPYLLTKFSSVDEVRPFLEHLNLVDVPFAPQIPLAPLHWIIADKERSIVLESNSDGLRVYDDPYDVLTNNPSFPFHRENIKRYRMLSNQEGEGRLAEGIDLKPFSVGFGSMFLPGDYTSPSRFVKACYLVHHAVFDEESDAEARRAFFRILDSVSFPKGSVLNPDGSFETTIYSSCMNLDRKTYCYKTESNASLTMVQMEDNPLDGRELMNGLLRKEEDVVLQTLSPVTKG